MPNYAYTEEAFFPAKDSGGWYSGISYHENGTPRYAAQVVVDSVQSQSGRAETAIWNSRKRLDLVLPALLVTRKINEKVSRADETERESALARETAQALGISVSSWETAHRHVDAWFRAATVKGEAKQVWDDSANDESKKLKHLISTASTENGDLLYENFPNAAVYGFWLSSGTSMRHKMPRAYSSEIVGYGALPVRRASTKLDPVGGASNKTGMTLQDSRYTIVVKKRKDDPSPSNFGFGQVPSSVEIRGFVCELILQQASISIQALRRLSFHDDGSHTANDRAIAARTVLCLLALLGWHLSAKEGFLRSGCALISTDVKLGWRRHGSASVETMAAPSEQDILAALREAISDAEAVGLTFSDETTVYFSDVEESLIKKRVSEEIGSVVTEGE